MPPVAAVPPAPAIPGDTYLASFTLSGTPTYTLQKTLPVTSRAGVFSSDGSKYYIGTSYFGFYTNIVSNPFVTIDASNYIGIIFSSDVTCAAYALSSDPPSSGNLIISGILASGSNSFTSDTGLAFIIEAATSM